MTYLSMLLQQDVNKLYPDILNHDIIPPPQRPGRVSHSFFLKRRPGLNNQIDFGGDKVIDYLQFNGNEYGLVKDGTNIKVYKGATLLATQAYNSNVNHKLFTTSGPSGAMLEQGTGASSNVTTGIFTITDSTKSRASNAYALKRIYIYDATVGTGQLLQIISNDSNTLTLYSGWAIQPTNISYKIFESKSEIVGFIGNDGIYTVSNDTQVIKVKAYGTVRDCVYNLGRLFVVDVNDNVIVSEPGTNCFYFTSPSGIIGTYSGLLGMVNFQDFVLMMCSDRIGMIKKETITVDTEGNTTDVFKIVGVTTTLGAFGKKSFTTYNQGLYVFTGTKKLIALTITPSGTDRFTVSQDDQGIYIQQFLDGIKVGEDVQLAINAEKVCMVHNDGTNSNIYMYDVYYKFRYRWNTLLPIHGCVVYNIIYFLGDAVYKADKALVKDIGGLDYTPRIRSLLGEEDIFSIKTYMTHKIYLGANTDLNTKVKYVCHIDGGRYEVNTSLNTVKYLIDSNLFNTDGTWGRDMFGYGIFGGKGFEVSNYVLGYVNAVELPISLTSSLTEVFIEGDIEFGGMLFQYEAYDPYITPVNSVSGLVI